MSLVLVPSPLAAEPKSHTATGRISQPPTVSEMRAMRRALRSARAAMASAATWSRFRR
jgi:hypothetical protein